MKKFRNSSKSRTIFGNKTVVLLGVVILIFLSVALGKELFRRYEVNQEISELESEISLLEKSNLDLDNLIDYFNTNSFAEKEARKKLGLQKQDETMVILPQNSNINSNVNPNSSSQKTDEETLSNPQRWWNYFFKLI